MERRFRIRLDELLEDAEVRRSLLVGVMPRLEAFLQPFVSVLQSTKQRTNAQHFVAGLLSDLPRKLIAFPFCLRGCPIKTGETV